MTPPLTNRQKLDNLADALVADILSASDQEILEEFREDHGDPVVHATQMRVLFEQLVTRIKASQESR